MSTRAMSQHSNGTVFARSALEDDEGGEGDEGGGATVDEVMYTEEVVTFLDQYLLARWGKKEAHTDGKSNGKHNGHSNHGRSNGHSATGASHANPNGVSSADGESGTSTGRGMGKKEEPLTSQENLELEELDDIDQLQIRYDQALVVHKGKSFESGRPNPYISDTLPHDMAKHLDMKPDTLFSQEVKSENLPDFFAELLEDWRRTGLLQVYGPESEEQARRSAEANWNRRGVQPIWALLPQCEGMSLQEAIVRHPDWGTDLMARQLYFEQRGVDIGVASYMKSRSATEKRGAGSSLGPVQRVVEMWFEPVMEAVQSWQEIFVMIALNNENLDHWLLETFENLEKAHGPQHTQTLPRNEGGPGAESRWDYKVPDAQHLIHLRSHMDGLSSKARVKVIEDIKVLGPILMSIPASKLSVIVLHELMSILVSSTDGKAFGQASARVGRAVQAEWGMSALKGTRSRFQVNMHQVGKAAKTRDIRKLNAMLSRVFRTPNFSDEGLLVKIGSLLISFALAKTQFSPALMKTGITDLKLHAQQADFKPALSHTLSRRHKKKGYAIGLLNMAPELLDILQDNHAFTANLSPLLLPMVVPPLKWQSFDTGCYLLAKTQVMRTVDFGVQEKQCRAGDMTRVYDALDVLSSTAWTINTRILHTIQRAWVLDLVIADIPQQDDVDLDRLDSISTMYDNLTIDEKEMKNQMRLHFKNKQKNHDLHSLRCSLINQLHVAVSMNQFPAFYFPHNLDFRGRAYPIPPHLNHLGSDICRGLLKFAETKALGKRGFYWLKVHLANLFGVNKMSFDDRVRWTEHNMSKIIAAAHKPLDEATRDWWLNADEPWQALATCFEIAAAVESGNPEAYMSGLPVHQDGSCNGLQHYAAMGLDTVGGEQVNLTPGAKPSDPYTTVGNSVIEMIQSDIANELSPDHEVAKICIGKVTRKVVKQTVMTTVYGVTYIGARDQIEARLSEAYGESGTGEITEAELGPASNYLAKQTLSSVGDIFIGANLTMGWLSQVAKQVAATGKPVQWITPLGLPVTQPYYTESARTIRTVLQHVRLRSHKDSDAIQKVKQRSAFPPNFVHSLDSTHLLLTALEFHRRGGTFAGVHDSFWTHPCDYDTLASVLREQFVELYSLPILANLKLSFERDYPEAGPLPPLPIKGELDLKVVLKSPYFFS